MNAVPKIPLAQLSFYLESIKCSKQIIECQQNAAFYATCGNKLEHTKPTAIWFNQRKGFVVRYALGVTYY